MDCASVLDIVFKIVGGLSIFLIGMKYLSDAVQALAGRRMRRMIGAVTDNPLIACATGTAVTALIQSSSVTTVMLVGLVNAGVMNLPQAIGVMLGADIGTTVTAWIVSLDVLQYGLPMLGVSGMVYLFSKSERTRYTAMLVLGVGMIFFGLEVMKNGLYPLREAPGFIAFFSRFTPHNFSGVLKCIAAGTLVTAIVQSSSATVAITLTLARTGVIDFPTAVALVLGQNIGTTATAFLASLGTSTAAKRVAWAHIVTKSVGAVLMGAVFFAYMRLLNVIAGDGVDIAKRIALSHTVFNVALVCLFLPLVGILARVLHRAIPDIGNEQPRLTYLDVSILESPALGIQQSADELARMARRVDAMFTDLRQILSTPKQDEQVVRRVFGGETELDDLQREIVEFLSTLVRGNITRELADETRKQIRMADEYESISDYLAALLKLHLKARQTPHTFSESAVADLLSLHDHVAAYVAMITRAVKDGDTDLMVRVNTDGDAITHLFKDFRQEHLNRLATGQCEPVPSMIFIDMLQSYRKIKNHAVNIAEALAGEK